MMEYRIQILREIHIPTEIAWIALQITNEVVFQILQKRIKMEAK